VGAGSSAFSSTTFEGDGTGAFVRASQQHRNEWKLWQEISKDNALDPEYRRVLEAGEWHGLKDGQKQERIDHWKETAQMRKELRESIREDVSNTFREEWRLYNEKKEKCLAELRAHDKEARRALKHYARLSGLQGAAVERKESRVWKKKGKARTRYKEDRSGAALKAAGSTWGYLRRTLCAA
jgi:hypothetical protein